MWTSEGEDVTSLAVSESRFEVALGRLGGLVELWDANGWSRKAQFHVENVTALQYGSIGMKRQNQLPRIFLLVSFVSLSLSLFLFLSLFLSFSLFLFLSLSLSLFWQNSSYVYDTHVVLETSPV